MAQAACQNYIPGHRVLSGVKILAVPPNSVGQIQPPGQGENCEDQVICPSR